MRPSGFASLILLLALAGCSASGPSKAAPPFVSPIPAGLDFHRLTFDEKMDYLATSLKARAGLTARADQQTVDSDIQLLLEAMASDQGTYTAAAVYVLLQRGPGRPPSQAARDFWEAEMLPVAQADPVLTSAITRRNFVSFPLFGGGLPGQTSQLPSTLGKWLLVAANNGDPKACAALANFDYVKLSESQFNRQKCAQSAGAPNIYQIEAQAKTAALRRVEQIDQGLRAEATRLAQHCAAVGVPTSSFNNPDRGRSVARFYSAASLPDRNLLKANPAQFIEDMAQNYSSNLEGQKLYAGSMITPVLTPRAFMGLARPMCGG